MAANPKKIKIKIKVAMEVMLQQVEVAIELPQRYRDFIHTLTQGGEIRGEEMIALLVWTCGLNQDNFLLLLIEVWETIEDVFFLDGGGWGHISCML